MTQEKPKGQPQDAIRRLRTHFFTGLLVLIPVYVTVKLIEWISRFVYRNVDKPIRQIFFPGKDTAFLDRLRTFWDASVEGFQNQQGIPGLGFVVAIVFILGLGIFARNYFGSRLIRLFERMLDQIPLIRRVYNGAKQVAATFLHRERNIFQDVVLIEYPRKGIWTLAFVTQEDIGSVQQHLPEPAVAVFVCTTPNPTSGFLIFMLRSELIHLNMTVEDGMKMLMSGGVYTPEGARALADQTAPRPGRLFRRRREVPSGAETGGPRT